MAEQAASDRIRVHPDRVRAVLDARLDDRTIGRLMACERLRGRLDARLGISPETAQVPESLALLVADPSEAARRAGALIHGQAVRALLLGPEVVTLVGAIGRDAHALGLRHGALALPRDHGGDLVGAILRDGHACLGAWLRGQDAALRNEVLLAMPLGTPVEAEAAEPDLEERAPTIMAQVAASYAQADGGDAHD